ncbi:hypothetical protein PR048_015815 [Dryococelus australis]|uniref:Uncharacterized protein n=1 Tax=Dryococelus australis TaxID=614101 RepID=A0ABQ9HIA8_9NEOP|nr:hypothetical protein PR048_015815 [Dryococelus australis]
MIHSTPDNKCGSSTMVPQPTVHEAYANFSTTTHSLADGLVRQLPLRCLVYETPVDTEEDLDAWVDATAGIITYVHSAFERVRQLLCFAVNCVS